MNNDQSIELGELLANNLLHSLYHLDEEDELDFDEISNEILGLTEIEINALFWTLFNTLKFMVDDEKQPVDFRKVVMSLLLTDYAWLGPGTQIAFMKNDDE